MALRTIYDLKPAFQNLLRPFTNYLAARGITANQVTVFACLLSVLSAGLVWAVGERHRWVFLLIPGVLFFRMALNAIDGMLAREHGQKSILGAFLNELCDIIADALLFVPFLLIASPPVVIFAVGASVLTEYAGVVSAMTGASRRYDGPMGKSDRAFTLGALAFLWGIWQMPRWLPDTVLVVLSLLALITMCNRIQRSLCEERV